MHIVSEYVVAIPFIGIVRIQQGISKDIAVLWIFQTMELIYKHSFISRWCRYEVEDNSQEYFLNWSEVFLFDASLFF